MGKRNKIKGWVGFHPSHGMALQGQSHHPLQGFGVTHCSLVSGLVVLGLV